MNQLQDQVCDSDERVNAIVFEEPDEFGEAIAEEVESNKLSENEQDKPEEEQQPKKPKRTRKTIEQELAELDARRQRLMEKKRSQEAHEKIVFGATIMSMLKDMKEKNDNIRQKFCDIILDYTREKYPNNIDIINRIIIKFY